MSAQIMPLAAPLPPVLEDNIFTEEQWETLLSIADTIIPSISSSPSSSEKELVVSESTFSAISQTISSINDNSSDAVRAYLNETPRSLPQFKTCVRRMFAEYMRPESSRALLFVLSALNTRAGCLLLTQSSTSFHLQPLHVRHQILLNWSKSYLAPLRAIQKAFKSIVCKHWLATSPNLRNIIGMPRAPQIAKTGECHHFAFLQFPPGDDVETLETDVVIAGSGCGGAVCALNIAQAGHRVMVVEKSYHFPPTYFPMTESEAASNLFLNGGFDLSDDGSTAMTAGSTWGGGGTVNFSASLQTPGAVRQEWADGGLPFFTSPEFQASMDRVCDRMGVSFAHLTHNFGNRNILEGSRKLGYAVREVPQNTGGHAHNDGYCMMGCCSSEKQGPAVAWLPDAAKHGATFVEGMFVEKVLFEQQGGAKRAIGVEGIWTSRDGNGGTSGLDRTKRRVVIKAKRVIVSAGTLHSPLLLTRSGLTNPMIGSHLHLHPVNMIMVVYPQTVEPWNGPILTSVCEEFSNEDGKGHGTRLECTFMMPSLSIISVPWADGVKYKEMCSKLRNMTGHIAIARDRDPGRVFPDPNSGKCRIQYSPSAFDRERILNGVIGIAKIAYVTGATEIYTHTSGMEPFIRPEAAPGSEDLGINDPAFSAWIDKVRAKGLPSPDASFVSAHQMGTCRMGTSPRNSVVDPKGQVWGTEGLHVADASVFPSASGVNPMITNMGIADWLSRSISKGLKSDGASKL